MAQQGGELCVDAGAAAATPADAAARPLHVVETKNRIAKVDGRHVHWVRTYTGGDRYSLVFYDVGSHAAQTQQLECRGGF